MNAEPEAEKSSYCLSAMLGSDSDAETSQEEPPVPSWSELSIIERVGLNSVEMSEKDLEITFSQIALAFRCDQYTLKQRLQAEEHARNLAEENIQLELTRGRETLEMLKGLCLDSNRSKILQRLELSLDILAGTVERISNTAEVLGAVHQEARASRAVEVMVAHVENLRRQHDRNLAELEEARKMIQQQSSSRNSIEIKPSPDPEEGDVRKKFYLQNTRRRVSVSLIPTQIQEKIKRDLRKQTSVDDCSPSKMSSSTCLSPSPSLEFNCFSAMRDDSCSVEERPQDPEESVPEASAQFPSAVPNSECLPSKQPAARKLPNKKCALLTSSEENSSSLVPRQRHKGKAVLSKKKGDKEKKSVNIYRHLSGGLYGSSWRHRPLVKWFYRCRWALLFTYLFALFFVLTLTYVLLESL